MIIFSILVQLFIWAIIIGAVVLVVGAVFALISGLIVGTSGIGLNAVESIKAKKFYEECVKKELGKPEKVSQEKLELVAELVGLKKKPQEICDIYLKLYRNDHPDEYPEYFAKKEKERVEEKAKRKSRHKKALIYATISIAGGALITYIIALIVNGGKIVRHYGDDAIFCVGWVSMALLLLCVCYGIESIKKEKQKKKEEKEKLEKRINDMK